MIGKEKKVVLAGAIGNTLEWYDFTIYAFFVPIIAMQFFPNKDPFLSMLATFGVFAIGFLVRPLGAVFFGYIGDHTGRRKALIISMIMMSFPTFLIGLLPNYHAIGILAPVLLTGLRIIQGLAVSGELTTATVFLIEHADARKRGFAGSLAMAGALLGMVLSAIFATLMSELLSSAQLSAWGWRVPFLLGGVIGVLGLFVRLRTIDPSLYIRQKKTTPSLSLNRHIASLDCHNLIIGIFLTSIMAVANYFLIAFFNTFLIKMQGLPLKPVMMVNTIAISMQVVSTLLMGRLSDYVGRRAVLGAGILSLIALVYPVFWLLTQHDIYSALLGECLFAVTAGALTGVIPTMLTEMFETHHRTMGISISYNVSLALFGGTAPLVAITLVKITHNAFSPAWYVMICACMAFLALVLLRKKQKQILA